MNDNETKAIRAICDDCDELDGWGFTRPGHMVAALLKVFRSGEVAGGYIRDLMDKNVIDVDFRDDTVWVRPEIFEIYA